jgi:altronate hydrolase
VERWLKRRLNAVARRVTQHVQPALNLSSRIEKRRSSSMSSPVAGKSVASTALRPVRVIRLNPTDDVVIALDQLMSGTVLDGEAVTVSGLIPPGHKVATRDIGEGEAVHRYGQIIGFASRPIRAGQHVHTHNLAMGEFARDYAFSQGVHATVPSAEPATFQGIVRADGRVATRNYIGILTSVNCSATVARAISDYFRRDIRPEALAAFPNVDGVVALTHGSGCAIDSEGDGLAMLQRTLGGYACHPNFASVLVIGLGCETNQISQLLQTQGLIEHDRLRTFTIQDTGGTTLTIAKGIELIREMLPDANDVKRETVPASHLTIGLQCGGSDGYSGVTANPVLGAAVDLLVRHGGTAILSETPEIYGAEHLLTRRAVTPAVGQKLVDRIRWWEAYAQRQGAQINNNPSAGNKAGGLTTVLEKSLGGIAKAGSTNLVEVYEYAQPVRARGLVFMDTPGYDPVSATGQVAGGANLICFTTGRGSAYGCAPSPSVKLATNTALWQRQSDDMDLNCGEVLEGSTTIEQLGAVLFQLLLDVASGKRSRSEQHGYGQNEFVPWQISAIM